MSRPRIAVICTEYRRNSHADVIAGRLLAGYEYEGRWREPQLLVVSMFTDQVPDNDMSRDLASRYGYSVHPSVAQALTLESGALAVDGVVLIGEHGDYPRNEKGQKLYPRYELYREIVEVFEASGGSVPVFCDKHLSTEWDKAVWMVEQSRRLGFPLLAGSVQPLSWRRPPLELDIGAPVTQALTTFHGPKEDYGIHALEILQCMVERRAGGETGIAAVQCLEGPPVWKWTDANEWAEPLLEAALRRSDTCRPGSPRDNCPEPILFHLEYRSGLQGACYLLNGHMTDRGFAANLEGQAPPVSTQIYAQPVRPFGHHVGTVHYIEEFVLTGRAAWPMERILLTTGALEALMDSSWRGNERRETPHLDVAYAAPPGSRFQREPVPAEAPEPL
jgi:hypothetical protein